MVPWPTTMKRDDMDRLLEGDAHLSKTLGWIIKSDDLPAAEEARMRIVQLSVELREKYSLKEPKRDKQVDAFHDLMHSDMHGRWGYVHPRILKHYEDRHFRMIKGVGETYAGHIRWLLRESGIGREPDKERGILATRLWSLKVPRKTPWCPLDLEEVTLGELRGTTMEELTERYDLDGRTTFVERMFELLKKA